MERSVTPREREAIALLSDGLSFQEVAAEMHIAPKTVSKHVENARRKLKARNATHAVAEMLRRGEIL